MTQVIHLHKFQTQCQFLHILRDNYKKQIHPYKNIIDDRVIK